MDKKYAPIGVFDSGVGGISVLRELWKLMPGENYLYFGDSASAPYGTRSAENVIELTLENIDFLLMHGAKAIVIACNTATSVSITSAREAHPDVPIIGIEPALKPAVLAKAHSRILVMATPVTLEQPRFNNMFHLYENDAEIVKVPCPGLVELIESGVISGEPLVTYLRERLAPYDPDTADAVVLGCTHYPLIRGTVQSVVPSAVIYDGGEGTARQTRLRLSGCGTLSPNSAGGSVTFMNSLGTDAIIALSKRLFALPMER